MLECVFQVDGGTAELQVDEAVPDLFSLLVSEDPGAIVAILTMRHILEHVVVPEDAVLDELLVSQGSHSAAVLVRAELEDLTFDFHVNVVVEEALPTEIPCNEDLENANKVPIV